MYSRIVRLERAIERRDYHLAEIERRLANVVRAGTIHQVDASKGQVRVKIGTNEDGEPVLSPWLPWTERAGTIKTWSPPSEGEQVRLIAPSGELANGWVDVGGFSSANPAPSDDGAAHVLTIGNVTITVKDDAVSIVAGEGSLSIAAGVVTAKGVEIVTDGPTKLNNGNRRVHFVGGKDTDGDIAVDGADDVFV